MPLDQRIQGGLLHFACKPLSIEGDDEVRAQPAHDRGDAAVLSRVRVPNVEEDRKRLLRERRHLVKERTSLINSTMSGAPPM